MKIITKKIFDLRKEIKPMKKDKDGYNYKYFDINQMIVHLQPLLEKHGLLLTQSLTNIYGKMGMCTAITDIESGETYEKTVPLLEIDTPQKMGSCITYFRRYALQSMLFLEAEDDDAAITKKAYKPPVKEEEIPF